MAVDTQVPQSRRALLAGALGGLAAAVATAIGRPGSANAATGSTMIIGSEANDAGTANTQLLTNSSVVAFKLLQNGPGTALMGYATPATGPTRGVYGRSDSPNGYGVQARNMGANGTGAAVQGIGGNNIGVVGTTTYINTPGVYGSGYFGVDGMGHIGVRGRTISPGYGVWGEASGAGASDARAVAGIASGAAGVGVEGRHEGAGLGVWGFSNTGIGVQGESSGGWAGYFYGPVKITRYLDVAEMAAPAAPGTNIGRLFMRDNGSGKTQLCVMFPTGAIQVLSTQP
jgi:hypothetical protein